jgi:hypothetical protein
VDLYVGPEDRLAVLALEEDDAREIPVGEPLLQARRGKPGGRPTDDGKRDDAGARDSGAFLGGAGALLEDQGVETAEDAATRQEVGSRLAKLPGGAAAQDEPPARPVSIVEDLDGIEDRRDILRLIDDDGVRSPTLRKSLALATESSRICEESRSLLRIRQVVAKRWTRHEGVEEGRLPGLAGAEEDMDEGLRQGAPQVGLDPTIDHIDFIILVFL